MCSPTIARVQLNLQAVSRKVAPQGTFSCPDGQFTLPHPTVKFVDRCNPQELSVVTRKRVARHGYPPGDLLLPFGQFTSCRACGDEAACVAVRNLALRRGREMGAQCAPLRKKKFSAVPIFRSGRRSLICVRLTSKGSGIPKGGNLGAHPFAHRRGYGAFCSLQPMQQFSFLLHYAIIKNKGMRKHADRNSTVRAA